MDAGGLPACRPRTIIVTDLNSTEDISPKQQKEKKKTGPKDYVLPSPFTCRPRSNDTVPNKKVVIKTFNEVTANRVRSARWPPRPRSEVMFEYLSRVGSSSGICTENRSSFKVQGHWDRQSLDDVSAEICRQIADDHRALKNVIPQRPFVNGGNPSTETLLLPDTSSSQQHIISIHDEPETLPPISQWYDGNRIAIHNQLSCSASTLPDSLQASLLNEPIPSKDSSICEEFSDYRQRYNLGMSKSDRRIYRKRASQEKCTRHHVQSTL